MTVYDTNIIPLVRMEAKISDVDAIDRRKTCPFDEFGAAMDRQKLPGRAM